MAGAWTSLPSSPLGPARPVTAIKATGIIGAASRDVQGLGGKPTGSRLERIRAALDVLRLDIRERGGRIDERRQFLRRNPIEEPGKGAQGLPIEKGQDRGHARIVQRAIDDLGHGDPVGSENQPTAVHWGRARRLGVPHSRTRLPANGDGALDKLQSRSRRSVGHPEIQQRPGGTGLIIQHAEPGAIQSAVRGDDLEAIASLWLEAVDRDRRESSAEVRGATDLKPAVIRGRGEINAEIAAAVLGIVAVDGERAGSSGTGTGMDGPAIDQVPADRPDALQSPQGIDRGGGARNGSIDLENAAVDRRGARVSVRSAKDLHAGAILDKAAPATDHAIELGENGRRIGVANGQGIGIQIHFGRGRSRKGGDRLVGPERQDQPPGPV